MRIIGVLLIAMLVIMGIAAATVEQVKITSPQDGARFTTDDIVKIRSQVSSTNDGPTFVRMLIDGNRVYTSNWKATAGMHTITVEAANNSYFSNAMSVDVTITVNPSPNSQ